MNGHFKKDDLIKYFQARDNIRFALLYGSAARGKMGPLSDLDTAVFFTPDLNEQKMAEEQLTITCDLMKLCRLNNIDVTILNLSSPFLTYQVFKYGTVLKCSSEKEFYSFKAKTLGRYQDIKPMYELYAKAAMERLQRG